MQLILASQSLARKKLLEDAGFKFEVVESSLNEDLIIAPTHEETIRLRAKLKGEDILRKLISDPYPLTPYLVLSADSGAILGKKHFEKPKDFEDALYILKSLSGQTHKLYTAYQIIQTDEKGREIKRINREDESFVTFHPLNEEQIIRYLKNNPQFLKYAGSYAINSESDAFIKKIEGSLANVIGLPMEKITPLIRKLDTKERE